MSAQPRTSIILIHNTLSRRDALAHQIHLIQQAEESLGQPLADADPALLERMLTSFTDQLIVVRRGASSSICLDLAPAGPGHPRGLCGC